MMLLAARVTEGRQEVDPGARWRDDGNLCGLVLGRP